MLGWEVIPRVGFGNFTVSPHGLGIALGYFVGTMLLARRARARGFSEDHAWNAAAISVVGAIIGARTAYVIGHFDEFNSPVEWLQIYKGGISLMGGLLGGFLAAYLYTRRQNIDFLRLADLGAPGIALGVAIGRIGDLVIGDHLGRETSGWWGWQYQGGELISPPPCIYETVNGCIQTGMVVHQTALYDMIWSVVILGLLLRLERKPRPKGFLTLTWASLYAAGRIATDFTRVDKEWFGLGLTGSQLTAIAVLGVCLYFLSKVRREEPVPVGAAAVPAVAVADEAARTQDTVVERRARAETGPEPEEPAATAVATAVETPARRRRRERPTEATAPSEGEVGRPPAARGEQLRPTREPAASAAPERESVFKEARERARRERMEAEKRARAQRETSALERARRRSETADDEEKEEPLSRARERARAAAAERASARSSRLSSEKEKSKPAEKGRSEEEEEDLDDFDWEP